MNVQTTNGHLSVPPARMVAQMRQRLSGAKLPKWLADHLAPVMESADDLTDDVLSRIDDLVKALVPNGVRPSAAKEALGEAVAALITNSGVKPYDEDDYEEVDPVENARAIVDFMVLMREPIEDAYQYIAQGLKLQAVIDRLESREQKMPDTRPRGPCYVRAEAMGTGAYSLASRMADGLAARIDPRHTPHAGRGFETMSLGDMAMTAARAAGRRPFNTHEAIRMATNSTSDFPLALSGALETVVARAVSDAPAALLMAAHEVPATDYRPGNALSLSASSVPEEVPEGGEIRNVSIDERGEAKPIPRDVAALFRLSNKAIANDQVGLLQDIAKPMIQGAREKQRRMLVEPLAANSGLGQTLLDGLPVFHESHGNLADTGGALSETTLSAARLALRSQRGAKGDHLNIEPYALVVPPQLETAAQKLIASITPATASDVNPFAGKLEVIVEVGLPSPTAWYLIGNPAQVDGLACCYLDGQKAPRVETQPGWHTLGMEFRLLWAFDAKFIDHRSWYLNPGA